MSHQRDKARADAGHVFRDGHVVNMEADWKARNQARRLVLFMRKPRRYLGYGKEVIACPECGALKPLIAYRVSGRECICQKCFHVWRLKDDREGIEHKAAVGVADSSRLKRRRKPVVAD